MAISLVSSEPDPQGSPEEEFISALIESGSYEPERWNVTDSAIRAHKTVHHFCLAYQKEAGESPPVHLVESSFPSFTFIPGLSVKYAAKRVRDAEESRRLTKAAVAQMAAIRDGAHDEAIAIMSETLRAHAGSGPGGIDALDFDVIREHASGHLVPVPGTFLQSLTGGHGAGEMWLVAAMWGTGKSYRLIEHSVAALEAGWDVKFFSLEMHAAELLPRLHATALRHVRGASLMDYDEKVPLLQDWYARCGTFTVFGPENGAVNAATMASQAHNEKTLLVVDYVGRMRTMKGELASEDHTMVARISGELCDVAHRSNVPVLAAAQLNRQGSLAGSVSLEMDADVIIGIDRLDKDCNAVRKNTVVKSRRTESRVSWYSLFDPINGQFHDITGEEALELKMQENAIDVF